MFGMKRFTILVLVACVCFAPCFTWRKKHWGGKKSLIKIAAATKKIFDQYNLGSVFCNFVCNEYSALCVPPWMDPAHQYNHCMDPKTAVSCALCLKRALGTASTPAVTGEPTHPPLPWGKEPTAVSPYPTIPGINLEFCMLLCNHFNNICLPEWLDPYNQFRHCDLTQSVGSSSWECIFCLESHIFTTNTGSPPFPTTTGTSDSQSSHIIPPPDDTTFEPTETVPATNVSSSDSCVQECYCLREIVLKMETVVDSCAVGHGCTGIVPTYIVDESDESTCGCDVHPDCVEGRRSDPVKSAWDPWAPWKSR